eukprot:9024390-Alexandrium_andersonii.AAC.1
MVQSPTSSELQTSRSGAGPSMHHVLPGTPGTSSAGNPVDFTMSPASQGPKTLPITPKYTPMAKYPKRLEEP